MHLHDWLLGEAADPSIRWQAMRDLTDAPQDAVAAERAKVATEGWGARLLGLQAPDGLWDGGSYDPSWLQQEYYETHDGQPWTGTFHVLKLLWELGLPPDSPQAQRAIALVRDNVRWDYDDLPLFDGEVEECINGGTLAIGATYGVPVDVIAERLVAGQQPDGGWNCDRRRGSQRSSLHSTICVLDGLLAYEQAGGRVGTREARLAGEEHLLERRLMFRASTGELIDAAFQRFFFPTRWFYDVLRGLDHLRATGASPAPRTAEAVQLVRDLRRPDGTWVSASHPGEVPFDLEAGDGEPSRINTLRALRVLRWAGDDVRF
ncbi:MAG: hypothetical protein AB7K08_10230 [Microbacteriaceae bacterium]